MGRLLGGTLAVEYVLGVIPMDFFESDYKNLPRDEIPTAGPTTVVKKALGMGSYQISYNPGHPLPRPMPGNPEHLQLLWAPGQRDIPDYLEPRETELPKSVVTAAAEHLPVLCDEAAAETEPDHIPEHARAEGSNLSVAEVFQSLVLSLEYYAVK